MKPGVQVRVIPRMHADEELGLGVQRTVTDRSREDLDDAVGGRVDQSRGSGQSHQRTSRIGADRRAELSPGRNRLTTEVGVERQRPGHHDAVGGEPVKANRLLPHGLVPHG